MLSDELCRHIWVVWRWTWSQALEKGFIGIQHPTSHNFMHNNSQARSNAIRIRRRDENLEMHQISVNLCRDYSGAASGINKFSKKNCLHSQAILRRQNIFYARIFMLRLFHFSDEWKFYSFPSDGREVEGKEEDEKEISQCSDKTTWRCIEGTSSEDKLFCADDVGARAGYE